MPENKVLCPKCESDQITADKKGFSGGKALAGAVLTGGIGLLAGTIGSKDIIITCLNCGHQFKPGEGGVTHDKSSFDGELSQIITTQGKLAAIKHCKTTRKWDLNKCAAYVDQLVKNNNLQVAKPQGGCAGIILILIIISITITSCSLIC